MIQTYGRSIKFISAEYIPTRTAPQLAKCLMKAVYGYARDGFVEFKKIKAALLMVEVITTAAQERISEIECLIRAIKGRVQNTTLDFLFNPVHMVVLVQAVYTINLWFNAI